jgi:hypothetical protein
MSYSCPPDLPFFSLIWWYMKQVLAALFFIGILVIVYVMYLIFEEYRKK